MKTASVLAMASAYLLAASAVRADMNLVQDSGFTGSETGVVTATSGPWLNPGYFPGMTSQDNVSIAANALAPSGYNAVLAPAANQNAVLFQFMSLTQGSLYNVSFWIANPTGRGGTLSVDLNGNVAGVINVAGNTPFTEYTFHVAAGSALGILDFVWNPGGSPGTLDIDDVCVSAPDNMGLMSGLLMLLPLCAFVLKRRKSASV
jgi:hypothetical protein